MVGTVYVPLHIICSSEAPVNQEKVDRLKKAIAEGEYKVNPDVLAKKMAVMESQILGVKA